MRSVDPPTCENITASVVRFDDTVDALEPIAPTCMNVTFNLTAPDIPSCGASACSPEQLQAQEDLMLRLDEELVSDPSLGSSSLTPITGVIGGIPVFTNDSFDAVIEFCPTVLAKGSVFSGTLIVENQFGLQNPVPCPFSFIVPAPSGVAFANIFGEDPTKGPTKTQIELKPSCTCAGSPPNPDLCLCKRNPILHERTHFPNRRVSKNQTHTNLFYVCNLGNSSTRVLNILKNPSGLAAPENVGDGDFAVGYMDGNPNTTLPVGVTLVPFANNFDNCFSFNVTFAPTDYHGRYARIDVILNHTIPWNDTIQANANRSHIQFQVDGKGVDPEITVTGVQLGTTPAQEILATNPATITVTGCTAGPGVSHEVLRPPAYYGVTNTWSHSIFDLNTYGDAVLPLYDVRVQTPSQNIVDWGLSPTFVLQYVDPAAGSAFLPLPFQYDAFNVSMVGSCSYATIYIEHDDRTGNIGADQFEGPDVPGGSSTYYYVVIVEIINPHIQVKDNSEALNISSGDATPVVDDGTDFGLLDSEISTPICHTFKVQNLGLTELEMYEHLNASTGLPDGRTVHVISSPNMSGVDSVIENEDHPFLLPTQIANQTLASMQIEAFEICITPSDAFAADGFGVQHGLLLLYSNDRLHFLSESADMQDYYNDTVGQYTFLIQATIANISITVKPNCYHPVLLPSCNSSLDNICNSSTASLAAGTDFGAANPDVDEVIERMFVIEARGSDNLTVSNVTVENALNWTVTGTEGMINFPVVLNPTRSDTLSILVRFNASGKAEGTYMTTMTIIHNDGLYPCIFPLQIVVNRSTFNISSNCTTSPSSNCMSDEPVPCDSEASTASGTVFDVVSGSSALDVNYFDVTNDEINSSNLQIQSVTVLATGATPAGTWSIVNTSGGTKLNLPIVLAALEQYSFGVQLNPNASGIPLVDGNYNATVTIETVGGNPTNCSFSVSVLVESPRFNVTTNCSNPPTPTPCFSTPSGPPGPNGGLCGSSSSAVFRTDFGPKSNQSAPLNTTYYFSVDHILGAGNLTINSITSSNAARFQVLDISFPVDLTPDSSVQFGILFDHSFGPEGTYNSIIVFDTNSADPCTFNVSGKLDNTNFSVGSNCTTSPTPGCSPDSAVCGETIPSDTTGTQFGEFDGFMPDTNYFDVMHNDPNEPALEIVNITVIENEATVPIGTWSVVYANGSALVFGTPILVSNGSEFTFGIRFHPNPSGSRLAEGVYNATVVVETSNGQSKTCMFVVQATVTMVTQEPWINEFHYENSGEDVGEFIEIMGLSSIDFTRYSLALYNGTNGQTYDIISVPAGTVTSCYEISVLNPSTIRDGGPDGIALVKDGTTVVEFISYEGTFTASNGPANGLTSIDVGVSESPSTSVGDSLQLMGSGSQASDFSWSAPSSESPGTINDGQTFTCAGGGGDPYLASLTGDGVIKLTGKPGRVFELIRDNGLSLNATIDIGKCSTGHSCLSDVFRTATLHFPAGELWFEASTDGQFNVTLNGEELSLTNKKLLSNVWMRHGEWEDVSLNIRRVRKQEARTVVEYTDNNWLIQVMHARRIQYHHDYVYMIDFEVVLKNRDLRPRGVWGRTAWQSKRRVKQFMHQRH